MTHRLSKHLAIWLLAGAATIATASSASAQYVDETDDVRFDKEKKNAYQIAGRFRAVAVPPFVLDAFYDKHANNWSEGRANFAYGLEFLWRKIGAFELSVAAEYADLEMPDAWWKQTGQGAEKADYVKFDMALASLVFSGYWYWDVTEWFSPYLGGGLGLGITLGSVKRYSPKRRTRCRNSLGQDGDQYGGPSCYDSDGELRLEDNIFNEEFVEGIWPVVPVVNITGGARFNFLDHGVVKIEVGINDYLFAGISAGAQW